MKLFCLAIVLLAASASAAAAAVVKEDIVGCRNEADLKHSAATVRTPTAHATNKPAINVSDAGKLKSGACAPLNKGITVSVDQKKGDLVCVRPYGGFDCFWTPTATINQSESEAPSATSREPGSRFKPSLNGMMPGVQTSF